MYTLILTLITTKGSNIETIPGFVSHDDAYIAGKKWDDLCTGNGFVLSSSYCVANMNSNSGYPD